MRKFFWVIVGVIFILSCNRGRTERAGVREVLLPFESDSGWGAMTPNGRVVFVLRGVEHLGWFSEGLAPFSPDGYVYGYVDTSGKVVIRANFRRVKEFKDGLAAVQRDMWGVIDRNGKFKIKPEYYDIVPANYGLFYVRLRNVWRLVDTSGRFIGGIYVRFYPFNGEGWAKVETPQGWGVIDTGGRWLVKPRYAMVDTVVGGVFLVRDTTGWGYVKEGRVIYWRKGRRLSLDSLNIAPNVEIDIKPPKL